MHDAMIPRSNSWLSILLTTPILAQCALSAALGVFSHIFVFIRGEYHLRAPFIFRFYLCLALALYLSQTIVIRSSYTGDDKRYAAANSVLLTVCYGGSLFTSITIYRVFLHRLSRFPGPPLASVSKLWHVWKVLDAKQYLFLDKLREQYGDYVRTGPNELTIFDPKAVLAVHGTGSPCIKAAWYENQHPLNSVHMTRSKTLHDKRRKLWDMAFSQKALSEYEPRVLHYAEELVASLAAFDGRPANATAWFSYFAFDIMSEITFGKPLNMLRDGKSHYVRDLLNKGVMVLGRATPVPWLFRLIGSFPGMKTDWLAFRSWTSEQLKERMQVQNDQSNVMSWLMQAGEADNGNWGPLWLEGDALTMIVGGSEPEASSILFLFYHLAQSSSEQEKLRTEYKSAGSPTDARTLQTLPALNGCINEALRLHPPLPSGMLRDTPPEGLNINGKIIPGNTTVLTPAYSLGRLESCFENACKFVPERWYKRPEMVRDKSAFMPFNIGRYACVGRNLGLMEMRIVTTLLVAQFDIEFAPGDDGTELFENLRDAFATVPGKLELIFRPRSCDEASK